MPDALAEMDDKAPNDALEIDDDALRLPDDALRLLECKSDELLFADLLIERLAEDGYGEDDGTDEEGLNEGPEDTAMVITASIVASHDILKSLCTCIMTRKRGF